MGGNEYGQLGNSDCETSEEWVEVKFELEQSYEDRWSEDSWDVDKTVIKSIVTKGDFNLAIDETGRVWGWGRNSGRVCLKTS